MSTKFIIEQDECQPEYIKISKSGKATYYYPMGGKSSSVSIDANGNMTMVLEGKIIRVPMYILSELADIKRCIDNVNPFTFGGKSRIYKQEID